jgi:hypothetical protein
MLRAIALFCLIGLTSPALATTWRCTMPYDEINGGGTVTLEGTRLTFASNWSHRQPVIATCATGTGRSECMTARLGATRKDGAAALFTLFTVHWGDDATPLALTIRQPKAIFRNTGDGFESIRMLPSLGYDMPLTDCVSG